MRCIGSDLVLERLIAAKRGQGMIRIPWLLATLGRLPPIAFRAALAGDPILDQLVPLLLLSDPRTGSRTTPVNIDLKFLIKQYS